MSTALAWCRQRPCNQGVTLHAHRGNAGALRWFRRFGFERVADESLRTTQLVAMELRADALPGQRSEEHTSELQSLMRISYAVFCLKKKKKQQKETLTNIQSHYT